MIALAARSPDFARPRRAVKPNAAWRRAEGAGLTAKARTERSKARGAYRQHRPVTRFIRLKAARRFARSHCFAHHMEASAG